MTDAEEDRDRRGDTIPDCARTKDKTEKEWVSRQPPTGPADGTERLGK